MSKPKHQAGQPGFYPGYHTLDQADTWDEATRNTVLARLNHSTTLKFFAPQEAALMQAVLDRMMPQDDRDPEHKIPILAFIDDRLHRGLINGFRYAGMPPDGEAHRLGLQAIDQIAHHRFGRGFTALTGLQQDSVLLTIHDAKPPAAFEIWERMPPDRYWGLLSDDVVGAYYAHPYAWDEIGFGGPAYPRGYMRLLRGDAEPWEVDEQRYPFAAPADSLSGVYTPLGKWPHRGSSS